MKKIYLILIACTLIMGCSRCGKTQSIRISGSPFRHSPIPPNAALFIILTGQSNALGRSINYAGYYTTAVNGTKRFDSTTQSFISYSAGFATNGFELQTAGEEFTRVSDTVRVIKVAQTSLPISDWGPNGFMFNNLRKDIDSAFAIVRRQGKTPYVLSTLWMQGEQNIVLNSLQTAYQDSLSHFIDNYMAIDGALYHHQFVMAKINTLQTFSVNDEALVNTSMDNIAAARNYCKIINPNTIGAVLSDGAHYEFASYILFANAWAALISYDYSH